MCARAISPPKSRSRNQRGSALVGAMIVFAVVSGLVYATTTISVFEVKDSRRSVEDLQAVANAETGVEMAKASMSNLAQNFSVINPIEGIASAFDASGELDLFDGAALMDNGASLGEYTVKAEILSQSSDDITIQVISSGYVPAAPQNLAPGEQLKAWDSVSLTMRYSLEGSEVFNYAYFINNWGWLYGNTIFCNGNARSNGQFDSGGYRPTITGTPKYEDVEWNGVTADLAGYIDDNGDGLSDGNDGGVFSGWDIVNSHNVKGNGGLSTNQHDFDVGIDMPNLTDLTLYEDKAIAQGSTVSVGGSTVVSGILGDDPGEKDNLFLVGTLADPIVIDGPIVVHGDVMISGYVTGQGAIYSGGNVYVPDSVIYLDPPSTSVPSDNSEATTEAWLNANWDKDFLGLFARENIAVGDFTNSSYKSIVGGWMTSSLNSSVEDAGEDGIPNTYAGVDGILGTADDDILEGDGIFSVDYYTAEDAIAGAIPSGYSIGDVVPGSGEDIDGDGVFDGQTSIADLNFQDQLKPGKWDGNMPPGGYNHYSDIATIYANQLDATFYTNHSFCWGVWGSDPAEINGSLVCRNESIVYGTPNVSMNYDRRLLGGRNGAAGGLLPQVLGPVEIVQWRRLDTDPLRYDGTHDDTTTQP